MDTALLELIRGVLTIGAGAWLWQSFQKKIEKIDELEKRIMYFEIRDKILQHNK